MVNVGFLVRLVAKEGQGDALAEFLSNAGPLADAEPLTLVWLAYRVDARTFYIADAFAEEAGRKAHLDGPIADALREQGPRLLAERPTIHPVDVLMAKLPLAS